MMIVGVLKSARLFFTYVRVWMVMMMIVMMVMVMMMVMMVSMMAAA